MSILKRCTDFVLQSRLHAMGVAFVCSYIPLLGSLGIIIAGLVTLRRNAYEGSLVALAATAPYFIKYFTVGGSVNELGINVIGSLCVWLFAVMLRRYNNWSPILEFAALLGMLIVFGIHIVYPEVQAWWIEQLTKYMNKTAAVVSGLPNPPSMGPKQKEVINQVSSVATGLLVVSVLFNAMLQLVLARWWQAIMFNPGGLREELRRIRFSHVMGVVLAVMFVCAWLGSGTVMDAMPVVIGAFAIAGLSFMHCYFATRKNTLAWLVIMYLLAIWMFPLSAVCLAIIAFFDIWMDLRKRLIRTV